MEMYLTISYESWTSFTEDEEIGWLSNTVELIRIAVRNLQAYTVIGLLKIWTAAHYVFNIQYGKQNINVALLLEDAVLKDKGENIACSICNERKAQNHAKYRGRTSYKPFTDD